MNDGDQWSEMVFQKSVHQSKMLLQIQNGLKISEI